MSINRINNRVAWDHSVLTNQTTRLDWRPPQPRVSTPQSTGHPMAAVVTAWVLIGWSALTAWRLWTRNDLESHISMRFLMRGDIEEVSGVILGLLWACIPAWAAFFLARRTREITMDDLGARAYWTSAIVSVIAAVGILRPTWDDNAGSRYARITPSSPPTQTSSAAEPAYDDGSGPIVEPAGEAAAAAPAVADDGINGSRHWARVRHAALLRAMGVRAGASDDAVATAPEDPG